MVSRFKNFKTKKKFVFCFKLFSCNFVVVVFVAIIFIKLFCFVFFIFFYYFNNKKRVYFLAGASVTNERMKVSARTAGLTQFQSL